MMKRSPFNKVNLLLLTAALIFGQVGAGFFHNKHDAHEAVVDLNQTVLVEHGEHCKICSVDWVHQFIESDNSIEITPGHYQSFEQVDLISFVSYTDSRASGRAPPFLA